CVLAVMRCLARATHSLQPVLGGAVARELALISPRLAGVALLFPSLIAGSRKDLLRPQWAEVAASRLVVVPLAKPSAIRACGASLEGAKRPRRVPAHPVGDGGQLRANLELVRVGVAQALGDVGNRPPAVGEAAGGSGATVLAHPDYGEGLPLEGLAVVGYAESTSGNCPVALGARACDSIIHAGQLLNSWSVAPRVRQHSRGIFSCLPIVAYRGSFTGPRGS